jgi:hypothetical protein
MKISYYLTEARKKNLYCRITDGQERVTFSLGHSIDTKEWNSKKEEGSHDDPYYYTLWEFKRYLEKRYHELKGEGKSGILDMLKLEASEFVDKSGIEGLARKMFDWENEKDGVYKYDVFIQAFEQHTGLSKEQYKAKTVGNEIYFHTEDNKYVIDTYEGLTARLKDYVERRSYDEIYCMTEHGIWSEIYKDPGILKHEFVPEMLGEWERYWSKNYSDIKAQVGNTDHLDELKAQSWRQFQVFMECYNDSTDIIKLASDIDDMTLYSLAVITMFQLHNSEECYSEYCELEFDSGFDEWESISIDDDDDPNAPILHIKECDD